MADGDGGFFGGVKQAWGNFRAGAAKAEDRVVNAAVEIKDTAVAAVEQTVVRAEAAVEHQVAEIKHDAGEAYDHAKTAVHHGVEKAEHVAANAFEAGKHAAHAVVQKAEHAASVAIDAGKTVAHVVEHQLEAAAPYLGKPGIENALPVIADAVNDALAKPATPVASKPGAPGLLDNAFAASSAAYDLSKGGKPPAGWSQVTYPPGSDIAKLMKTAEAYELVSPDGQHFMAFTGTHKASDVLPDVGNFLDVKTEKYVATADLAEKWKAEHPGQDIIATGHSLGGGEAKEFSAVLSHGGKQMVAIGFNAAPLNGAVLADHGVDIKNLNSLNVQVVNKHDPLNRFVEGGVTFAGNGNPIADLENKNQVIIQADGKGSAAWISGHAIASLADPSDPTKLVATLSIDGSPIDKANADRLSSAARAASDPQAVTQTLEKASPAQTLKQELTNAR